MSKLKINRFYYNPLPKNLFINHSKIHGHGIFAKENIKINTDLGCTHIKVPMVFGYIRTPLGGFVNHAKNNNCELHLVEDWDDYLIYNIFTVRKILKGEEILLNYDK